MKIKSLLIGSAAVMAAASGARAADAVVMAPAPEPVEYVRVCDVYGAGFYYIPGTETCLKIGGMVFYEIGATSDNGLASGDTPNYHGYDPDEYTKYMRTQIWFDARSETEWGTLRGYIRAQSDYTDGAPNEYGLGPFPDSGNDPNLGLDQAWLSLGGFRAGYSESAFVSTPNGGPSGWGSHAWYGLDYGYDQRQFVQYNFTGGNGFFGTISLENDENATDPNYVPDVVGKVGVTQGWGTAWATIGIDETADTSSYAARLLGVNDSTGDSEWTASAGIHLNIPGMQGDSLRVIGYYASDPNVYWSQSEWAVLASYWHQFTPEFGASVAAEYESDIAFDAADSPDRWMAELNMVWTPVTDFEIRSEINYSKITDADLDGSVSGFLRFTRYFGR